MSEQERPPRITAKSERKYAFTLSLILLVAGLMLNVITIFFIIPWYELPNMALWYISIVLLFFAVIVGLLGLLAED